MTDSVTYYMEFQTHVDLENGTWTTWESFSSYSKAMKQAEWYNKAYVNVRIRAVRTSESVERHV